MPTTVRQATDRDVERRRAFFGELGFGFDPAFSEDTAAALAAGGTEAVAGSEGDGGAPR